MNDLLRAVRAVGMLCQALGLPSILVHMFRKDTVQRFVKYKQNVAEEGEPNVPDREVSLVFVKSRYMLRDYIRAFTDKILKKIIYPKTDRVYKKSTASISY